MTNEEIAAYQQKERAFLDTEIGKAFHRFKLAHSRMWQNDHRDDLSDRKIREISDAEAAAEKHFRTLLDQLMEKAK